MYLLYSYGILLTIWMTKRKLFLKKTSCKQPFDRKKKKKAINCSRFGCYELYRNYGCQKSPRNIRK